MAGGFSELPGITADVGLSAWGDTPEEAFSQAVQGLASLLSDTSLLAPRQSRPLAARSATLEGALVGLLNEVIFLAESEGFLPLRVQSLALRPGQAGPDQEKEWTVEAALTGEPYDPSRHRLLAEVKAATWHRLEVSPEGPGGSGRTVIRVIFDV